MYTGDGTLPWETGLATLATAGFTRVARAPADAYFPLDETDEVEGVAECC